MAHEGGVEAATAATEAKKRPQAGPVPEPSRNGPLADSPADPSPRIIRAQGAGLAARQRGKRSQGGPSRGCPQGLRERQACPYPAHLQASQGRRHWPFSPTGPEPGGGPLPEGGGPRTVPSISQAPLSTLGGREDPKRRSSQLQGSPAFHPLPKPRPNSCFQPLRAMTAQHPETRGRPGEPALLSAPLSGAPGHSSPACTALPPQPVSLAS